jgi:hypothetical protein
MPLGVDGHVEFVLSAGTLMPRGSGTNGGLEQSKAA